MKSHRLRFRETIISWLVVYPLITLLLWLLNPVITAWPLPAKTFLLTVLVVPIMSFWALPMAFRGCERIEEKYFRGNAPC